MRTKIVLITTIIGLYSTGSWATVVDNATMLEIPPFGSKGMSQPGVVKHPDYKKLVDDLSRLQEKLKTSDDKSAAIGRQHVDAAFNRLREYIDSGKPTFLSESFKSEGFNRNPTNNITKKDVPEVQVSEKKYEKILYKNEQAGNVQSKNKENT